MKLYESLITNPYPIGYQLYANRDTPWRVPTPFLMKHSLRTTNHSSLLCAINHSDMHHRKSYRLKGYDYTRAGLYYITICTRNRELFFGNVVNNTMFTNPVCDIAKQFWSDIAVHYPHVVLHEFIIMPNHIHGIIEISDTPVGTRHGVSQNGVSQNDISHQNEFGNPIHGSIPVIINQYKSAVKRWCNKNNHEDFQWQSRYYDHIIRSFEEFEFITDYIWDNPAKWTNDPFQHK